MPRNPSINKVLVLGSGPIVIGQAAEFDYAGTQACRVLKEEGIETVLINSNPATIMTDKGLAEKIFLEPIDTETVKRIAAIERPDSMLANIGGQTGLTVAMQLHREGFFEKTGIKLLGTGAEAIERAEDRDLFKRTMIEIGLPVIPSGIANSVAEARQVAEEIGYPVIIRPAFTLGGSGGGVARQNNELENIAAYGLKTSPIGQVLVEKYIYGWKEIEFEVMRDGDNTAIVVCSMENIDPVGVHTGDSIVTAPALTLSDLQYEMLRLASLKMISALQIEGGCNCQFALKPDSMEYAVIEVNPRVSRSSALASKATGYPIAKVATKIALGYHLREIKKDVTGFMNASVEPAIDYTVVKFPRWPFDKFVGVKHTLGTSMKATGEVMAIGQNFLSALQKAVRGTETGRDSLALEGLSVEQLTEDLALVDDLRLFRVFTALKNGFSIEQLYDMTRIDLWFLKKLRDLALFELSLEKRTLDKELYLEAKILGYPDRVIRRLSGQELPYALPASYRMVGEGSHDDSSSTPYLYAVYGESCQSRPLERNKERIVVLGSGPIRIGQGIEFDYSSVHAVLELKRLGYEVVVINNNPETVSTDFDLSDRLYFEPLTEEDVLSVIDVEKPIGVIAAFGGQTAIKLTRMLAKKNIPVIGTTFDSIDLTEDRSRFDRLLETLSIDRPRGGAVRTEEEAVALAETLGYPVLVRPSYVIGGQNMTLAYSERDVRRYMRLILAEDKENPILIDKYLSGTEVEVDVVFDGEEILIPGIMEHIERAGVHSGDSIAVFPSFNLTDAMREQILLATEKLARAVNAKGLLNIQFLIHDNKLYVIEVNPRSSRTVPYISKVTGLPIVDIAVRVMLGQTLREQRYPAGLYRTPPYYAVKVPVFSVEKLADVDFLLGPQMKSTGEVLGIGRTLPEALFKGLRSAGYNQPTLSAGEKPGILLTVNRADKFEIVNLAKTFDDLGFRIFATGGTAGELEGLDADLHAVEKLTEGEEILDLLQNGSIHAIVYTASGSKEEVDDYIRIHQTAMKNRVACLTSIDTASALADSIKSRFNERNTELVDLNHMRAERQKLHFTKMQGTADDHIFFENFDGSISAPESLATTFSDRHRGIGATGIVLIESSEQADAKMRIFNGDGSEAEMAGNSIRCVGKYLYDSGLVRKEEMTIETIGGIRSLRLLLMGGEVTAVAVQMGKARFEREQVPFMHENARLIDHPLPFLGKDYRVTCLSIGNPHCVIFSNRLDRIPLSKIGPVIEHDSIFPERTNVEFVRVINSRTLKLRVWERGNGETPACGTGAVAAAVAAVENGYCEKAADIVVKLPGGDLVVNYRDDGITLTGDARLVYRGEISL